MKTIHAAIFVLLLSLFSACAPKVNDPADVQAIKNLLVSGDKAWLDGNADAVFSSYWADNAIRMEANQPALVGKEAIRTFARSALDIFTVTAWTDTAEDVRMYGDFAVARGSGSGSVLYKNTGITRSGKTKWIAAYEKQGGGTWKCVFSCGNSDLPAADGLPGKEEIALQKIEQDWAVASAKNDGAALDKLLATEYANNTDGLITPKKQILANMKSGASKVTSVAAGEMTAMIFGETAVVHGLWTEKSTLNGKDTGGTFRYTDTFIKRDGRWQAVTTYSTKLKGE